MDEFSYGEGLSLVYEGRGECANDGLEGWLMFLDWLFAVQVAQVRPDPSTVAHCTGARQGEVCTESGRATLRRELGVRSLEDEVADGVEIYRAFYLEGGGGLPSIAFVRRPGANPAVEVSGTGDQKLAADVSMDVWRQVQNAGRSAHLALAPSIEEQQSVCMEGGAVLAEVGVPPPGPRSPSTIERRAVSSCSLSPTATFARLVETLSVPLFPGCAAIESAGGGAGRLYFCFRLSGDQVAAAQVMNRLQGEPYILEGDSTRRVRQAWQQATGVNPWTRLTWNGTAVPPNPGGRDAGGATDFLIAKSAEMPSLRFRPFRFNGVSSTVVTVEGEAEYRPEDASGDTLYMIAEYQQTWVYRTGGNWQVTQWTVGPFSVLAP